MNMNNNLNLKLRTIADFIIAIGLFFIGVNASFPSLFLNLIVFIIAIAVFMQALDNVDSINGYGKNHNSNSNHSSHSNQSNHYPNHYPNHNDFDNNNFDNDNDFDNDYDSYQDYDDYQYSDFNDDDDENIKQELDA